MGFNLQHQRKRNYCLCHLLVFNSSGSIFLFLYVSWEPEEKTRDKDKPDLLLQKLVILDLVFEEPAWRCWRKGAQGLTVRPLCSSKSRMTQFLRDQASDSEEVVTPLMLDGTYLSRNFATLGPLTWQPPYSFLTHLYSWWRLLVNVRS